MTDQNEKTPQDPPVRTETPEARMTAEGGPAPVDEEERGREKGPEYAVITPESGKDAEASR